MTNCEICDKPKRPLLRAVHEYTKDGLEYDKEVFACLECLGVKKKEAKA